MADYVPHGLAPSLRLATEALVTPAVRADTTANLRAAGYPADAFDHLYQPEFHGPITTPSSSSTGSVAPTHGALREDSLKVPVQPSSLDPAAHSEGQVDVRFQRFWGETPTRDIHSRLVELFYSDENVINVCTAIFRHCLRALGPQCPPREDFVIGRIDALTRGFHEVAQAFHGYCPSRENLQHMNRECVRRVTEEFVPHTIKFETQEAIRRDPFQFYRMARTQPIDQDTINRWRARQAMQKPMGETVQHPMEAIFGTRGIESFDQIRAFKELLRSGRP